MKSWLSTRPGYSMYFCLNSKGGLDSQKCTDVSTATTYLSARSKGTKVYLILNVILEFTINSVTAGLTCPFNTVIFTGSEQLQIV